MIFKAFPDINWSIKELFAEEDRVIVWNIVTGTHEGEFAGIPATGKKVEVGGICIARIESSCYALCKETAESRKRERPDVDK